MRKFVRVRVGLCYVPQHIREVYAQGVGTVGAPGLLLKFLFVELGNVNRLTLLTCLTC